MLTLEYANCLAARVGPHGIDDGEFAAAAPAMARFTDALDEMRGTSGRWRDLPFQPMRGTHERAIRALVDRLRPGARNLLVLGIGGSAMGNIALQSALNRPTYNILPADRRGGPRLFVLDNVDPDLVRHVLDEIRADDPDFSHTVVNVISKSGETAETAAQFLIVRSMLRAARPDDFHRRIVAVTDPDRGTMRAICEAEGYATLPVPDGVGGRFSVLSPVGLFSAAMCGVDIAALLDGAADMDARCRERAIDDNPAAALAWILVALTRRGKPIHVLMPYANALYGLADWFRQLWAESLGKRVDRAGNEVHAGATPIKALGATDQHSQIQLYREGPNDKVIGFVEVGAFGADVDIPSDLASEPLQYLQGSTLATLLAAEKRATEYALTESLRPNYTIKLPRIDARSVGEFIQLWQVTTAYAALLLDIDAYDQPAVETGKKATFGLMGRVGFEAWKAKVNEKLG